MFVDDSLRIVHGLCLLADLAPLRFRNAQEDLNHRRIAGVVLQAIMFNVFSSTISGTPARAEGETGAEGLWDLLLRGIGSGSAR